MTTVPFVPTLNQRISLAAINATVSARLGPTRVPGNEQPACFNRQVAMYLARHVGRWSTTAIGRFYNGRDHSTVCHGIQRIKALRESDPTVGVLIDELKHQLVGPVSKVFPRSEQAPSAESFTEDYVDRLANLVARQVCAYLDKRMRLDRPLLNVSEDLYPAESRVKIGS